MKQVWGSGDEKGKVGLGRKEREEMGLHYFEGLYQGFSGMNEIYAENCSVALIY